MDKEKVLSGIYLRAVLPLMEELVEYDRKSADLAKGWNCSIMFHVSNGPAVTLKFKNGKCQAAPGTMALPTIAMWFGTPEKLNRMFGGENVIPVIWKGIWHFGKLTKFTEITKRLDYYMKPTEEVSKNPEDKKFVVQSMMYAALRGAIELAQNDDHMKAFANGIQQGTIQVDVLNGGPSAYLVKDANGFTFGKGKAPSKPDAVMEIKDIDLAFGVFTGTADTMAALGLTDIKIKGCIPMVDNLNGILDGLNRYLNPPA